ncbi:MAG: homoserine O-succinyltransferase [Oscillospiraceae bacterium]|nr:homoserine O-succinyltransferase [Oscillospiraceae bacterium]
MPIKVPDNLPALRVLESENIFVMTRSRADTQDIRPLKLLILNLMPTKIATETQLLRALSNTPLQVEIELMCMTSHVPRHTPQEHLLEFYTTFDDVCRKRYDGMIITGAPVEKMDFEEVDYWRELCDVMDWSRTHVFSSFHICWGAQAALYRHYGIRKYPLAEKVFGVFTHRLLHTSSPLTRGFDDYFLAPHSRHTEVRESDVRNVPALRVLAVSDAAGLYLAESKDARQVFATGHSEYDADTLSQEYFRDRDSGLGTALPVDYFPEDDTTKKPMKTWRSHAFLLYTNWLNYYVYQATPYNIDSIGEGKSG